jgi:hypothetical protein
MRKLTEESYELSTGKVIYPNCGIIGLSENEVNGFSITEGYDGYFMYPASEDHYDTPDLTPDLTADEAKELALYMSELWLRFSISLK